MKYAPTSNKSGKAAATKKRAIVFLLVVAVMLLVAMGGMRYLTQLTNDSVAVNRHYVQPNDIEVLAAAGDRSTSTAAATGLLSAEHELAGFLHPSIAQLPPLTEPLQGESNKDYSLLNIQYHAKRAKLRQYQTDNNLGPLRVHTFYTVDCTLHSLWQVLAMEQSWEEVQQGGFISRVIAGCKPGNTKANAWLKSVLSPQVADTRFGAYYAPESSTLPNGKYYAPYNRPNAIWYWLNHTDLTEQVFILTDPDMYYMHRLNVATVTRGHPAAQYYGYMEGTAFERYKCPLCPDPSRAYRGGGIHNKKSYSVGPPWVLHVDDFRTMMPTWVQLVPMLRDIDDIWIIEMVAYAVAAAFHGLPHTLFYHGMVDNVRQEPLWDNSDALTAPGGNQIALLHYCYTWEVGEVAPKNAEEGGKQHDRMVRRERSEKHPITNYYHWSKYRTPSDWPGGKGVYAHNVLDCNCPLLQEIHTSNALPLISDNIVSHNWRRTMVFLRMYLPGLNKALTSWKRNVLNCTIPTPEEHEEFEKAIALHLSAPGSHGDPTSVHAPSKFKKILNLAKQLRTSHPTYWISRYVINSTSEDLRSIVFEEAKVARARDYEAIRKEQLAATNAAQVVTGAGGDVTVATNATTD